MLAITKAFGDFALKNYVNYNLKKKIKNKIKLKKGVNCEPFTWG